MNMNRRALITIAALVTCASGMLHAQSNDAPPSAKAAGDKLTIDSLFPTDRVLDVRITVAEDDWDTIRHQSRTFQTALHADRKYGPLDHPYTYVNASVTIDGVAFPKVGIRKKGFIGSQSAIRPSLKVKLNYVDPGGVIDGLNNLTFNNSQQDGSMLSQFMGYALFNATGSPAPRCAYAQITVNGRHLGVYSHVESARRPLAKRGFGDDTGTFYEGTVVDFFEGWDASFEKKFGKDVPGRQKIKQLIKALQGDVGELVFSADAMGRGWVPTGDQHDQDWMAPEFDDSDWKRGRNGAGYERGEGYESLISEGFNFKDQMDGQATSAYLRFAFEVDDPAAVAASGDLMLRMKYDDGFVAYLNGHKVAAANAPRDPRWDSKATNGHDDPAAMSFESIDISEFEDKLRKGRNVLAIHGLNLDQSSSDMLIVAEIRASSFDYEQAIGEVVDLDAFYRFWAVEGLLGFWDGYSGNRNNFFFYLNPKTDKLHFLPWGADSLFEKFSRLRYDRRAPLSVKTTGLIAHKLYQLESGRKRDEKTMRRILDEHWDAEALVIQAKHIAAMVLPYMNERQKSRLPSSLERALTFMLTRKGELLQEIENGMPMWPMWRPGPPPVIDDERPGRDPKKGGGQRKE